MVSITHEIMDKLQRLGHNIRCIRVAYGETQEDLGAAIGVEKNTVSYYENGKREPNKDTLRAIAVHYMVSVEELLSSDFSNIGEIVVNPNALWEHIDEVFPVTCSDAALKNAHFKKAYTIHRKFFDQLKKIKTEANDIDICIEEYWEACEDKNSPVEASANFVGLFYLLMGSLKLTPMFMKNHPAAMLQVISRNPKVRRIIENTNPNLEKDVEDIFNSMDDLEVYEMLSERLTIIKKSEKWYPLADYYLAMPFIWNLVENNLGFEINRRIGVEMLNALVAVGNPYAAHFLFLSQ